MKEHETGGMFELLQRLARLKLHLELEMHGEIVTDPAGRRARSWRVVIAPAGPLMPAHQSVIALASTPDAALAAALDQAESKDWMS